MPLYEVEESICLPAMSGYNALQSYEHTPISQPRIFASLDSRSAHKSAQQIVGEINQKYSPNSGCYHLAPCYLPIQGLGNGSGYSLYIEDRAGLGYGALQNAVSAFQSHRGTDPRYDIPGIFLINRIFDSLKYRWTAKRRRRKVSP